MEIEGVVINHKSNRINLHPEEEIEIIKGVSKGIKIGEYMEAQEEDIMVATKMEITIEVIKGIEENLEEEGDIEVDFKAENVMSDRVNTKRIKEISQDNKIIISKRETISIYLRLLMSQQNSPNQTNKTVLSEATGVIVPKLTLRVPTITEAITETTTIETIIIKIITTDSVTAITIDNTSQERTITTIIETIIIAINNKTIDLLKMLQMATPIETRNLLLNINKKKQIVAQQITLQKEEDAGHNQVYISLDVKWRLLIALLAISTANYWLYPTLQ